MQLDTFRSVFVCSLVTVTMAAPFVGCDDMTPEEMAEEEVAADEEVESRAWCEPLMTEFPIAEAHNIGYEGACAPNGCPVSCPDVNANSDWSASQDHHGIDVFARHRAPVVAVADGTVEYGAEHPQSPTSGIAVKIVDACGWSYYYGHLDEALVVGSNQVVAGQLIGYMGSTGAASTHLHFNMSPGGYYEDIDPIGWLASRSPTACGAGSAVPALKVQNDSSTIGFTDAAGTCYFQFRHGNYGSAAYAAITMLGGACARVRARVTAATDPNNIFSTTKDETVVGAEALAVHDGAPLIGADYCLETGSGGSYVFGYDAFTGNLRDEAVRGYGCDG